MMDVRKHFERVAQNLLGRAKNLLWKAVARGCLELSTHEKPEWTIETPIVRSNLTILSVADKFDGTLWSQMVIMRDQEAEFYGDVEFSIVGPRHDSSFRSYEIEYDEREKLSGSHRPDGTFFELLRGHIGKDLLPSICLVKPGKTDEQPDIQNMLFVKSNTWSLLWNESGFALKNLLRIEDMAAHIGESGNTLAVITDAYYKMVRIQKFFHNSPILRHLTL